MLLDFRTVRSSLLYFQGWILQCGMCQALFDSKIQCSEAPYDEVGKCRTLGRESEVVVADLDGTITRSASSFSYFMLIAYEAGSPLRALLLLLSSPVVWLLHRLMSESLAIQLLIFVSFAGLRVSEISAVARCVLCRFYLEDMHPQSYKILISCRKRYVVTANPTIMVEPFLYDYLEVQKVIGTEVQSIRGFCTGFVRGPGVMVGKTKCDALAKIFRDKPPDIGIADRPSDYPFLAMCKEAYIVPSKMVPSVSKEEYLKPLVFHDGRLAIRPTPMASILIFLWLPMGFLLAVVRLVVGKLFPREIAIPLSALLGVHIRVRGAPPLDRGQSGMLYVCSHRTLLDPIFLSASVGRSVTAVTYSLSRLSEFLSPIKTVRLTRCRVQDAKTIQALLEEGDLVICPEGTTCREPYLLRFSPLFAELTDDIVPVIMNVKITLFHGTTARGFKGMDPFYFLMNPCPSYTVTILDPLPKHLTCGAGKSSIEVANYIQKQMAEALGYQCTTFTRRDKYRILAGNDGLVRKNIFI
eukprot:c3126_g1_i1 orf=260-1834(-)